MAAAALPATLRSITATKTAELEKQGRHYEDTKNAIKTQFENAQPGREKSLALVDGICKLEGVRIVEELSPDDEDRKASSPDTSEAFRIKNYARILRQAWLDPAFSKTKVDEMHGSLLNGLQLKTVRHAHSRLYSELVAEWITNDSEIKSASSDAMGMSGKSEIPGSYENVGRKEMHEQRREWESLVYGTSNVDAAAVKAYLEKLFTTETHVERAYNDLRKKIRNFSFRTANVELCSPESLKGYIKGLLSVDLLNEEKKAILEIFSTNKEVLKEVSDVLNMRFKSLNTWKWTTVNGAVTLEQRRQLNGKYRVYMDEDVLDALMIHVIGMKWAVHFRSAFFDFFHTFAWSRSRNTIPIEDRERREWFLGQDSEKDYRNVQKHRHEDYAEKYFLTQLPTNVDSAPPAYSDESDDSSDVPARRMSSLEIKHGLLHLLITEALVARHLNPGTRHSVIRSDFKWFGPALPHTTIFTVLSFFGVNDFWLDFFRKFLTAPMRFSQDGPDGEVHNRSRGVPMSHTLADSLSESVLFVMDFAVNASTKSNLYRLHDDFWFWGPHSICKTAWEEMRLFAGTMGIEFNEEKTGSVVFLATNAHGKSEPESSTKAAKDGLPSGSVRWGFLELDMKTTSFKIDQGKVDEHIEELKLQLKATKSVFGYIEVYNAYLARFFSNNFGKPSYAFGRKHIDEMIGTFARVQTALFPNGRVVDHLSKMTAERFDVPETSLPDGFWFLPIRHGGMELKNPVVPLFNMREDIRWQPERILQRALEKDETEYLAAKERFELQNTGYGLGKISNVKLLKKMQTDGDKAFISKEEFLRHREERSENLLNAYKELLLVPEEVRLSVTPELQTLVGTLKNKGGLNLVSGSAGPIREEWGRMEAYWQWIVAVHGREVVERYGSLALVDPVQIPLGVVGVMKAGKVRWQG